MQKEVYLNTLMKEILHSAPYIKMSTSLQNAFQKEIDDFFMDVEEYRGCIINRKTTSGDDLQFDDRTGLECDCNELLICIDQAEELPDAIPFVLQNVEKKLTEKYPQKTFCIILSADQPELPSINVRFHLLRYTEELWLDYNNIEKYGEPVICEIIEA